MNSDFMTAKATTCSSAEFIKKNDSFTERNVLEVMKEKKNVTAKSNCDFTSVAANKVVAKNTVFDTGGPVATCNDNFSSCSDDNLPELVPYEEKLGRCQLRSLDDIGIDDMTDVEAEQEDSAVKVRQYPQLIELPAKVANNGCGRGSPVIYSRDSAPDWYKQKVSKITPLARVLEKIAEDGLADRLAKIHPTEWKNSMFDEMLKPAEDAMRDLISESLGEDACFDVPDGQPFRLNLLRQVARLVSDDDEQGVAPNEGVQSFAHTAAPMSGLWPFKKNGKDLKYNPSKDIQLWARNYSTLEDPPAEWVDEIDRMFEKEVSNGWVREMKEGEQMECQGILGVVFEGYRECSQPCIGNVPRNMAQANMYAVRS